MNWKLMLCAVKGHKLDEDHWCLRCGLRLPTLPDLIERAIKRNQAAMIRSLNANVFFNGASAGTDREGK